MGQFSMCLRATFQPERERGLKLAADILIGIGSVTVWSNLHSIGEGC
jgi:hypothetical protein